MLTAGDAARAKRVTHTHTPAARLVRGTLCEEYRRVQCTEGGEGGEPAVGAAALRESGKRILGALV